MVSYFCQDVVSRFYSNFQKIFIRPVNLLTALLNGSQNCGEKKVNIEVEVSLGSAILGNKTLKGWYKNENYNSLLQFPCRKNIFTHDRVLGALAIAFWIWINAIE